MLVSNPNFKSGLHVRLFQELSTQCPEEPFFLAGPLLAEEPKAAEPTPPARPKANVEPCAVEVRLADGSVLKLLLREDKFNVATKFGKLAIPVVSNQNRNVRS